MSPASGAVAERAATQAVAARQPARPASAPAERRRHLRLAAAVQAAWLAELM